MRLADRRYLQITVLACLVTYSLFLWQLMREWPPALPRGENVAFVSYGVVFLAVFAAVVTAIVVAAPLRILMNVILKDRRRSHRSETVGLTLLLVLIVGYGFEVRREQARLAPPVGVATLPAFVDAMPPPQYLELVHNDGREYVAWFGEVSGPLDVPSGPSCYLFDDSGDLIDWQPETGDGGPVEAFLQSSERLEEEMTLEKALTVTRNAAAK